VFNFVDTVVTTTGYVLLIFLLAVTAFLVEFCFYLLFPVMMADLEVIECFALLPK